MEKMKDITGRILKVKVRETSKIHGDRYRGTRVLYKDGESYFVKYEGKYKRVYDAAGDIDEWTREVYLDHICF